MDIQRDVRGPDELRPSHPLATGRPPGSRRIRAGVLAALDGVAHDSALPPPILAALAQIRHEPGGQDAVRLG